MYWTNSQRYARPSMQRAVLKDRQANYHHSSYLCSSALHMVILDLLASRRKSLIRSLDIYDFTAFKPCGKMLLGNVLRFTVAVDPILVMKSLRSLLAFFYSTYLSTLRPCSSLTALECRRNSHRLNRQQRDAERAISQLAEPSSLLSRLSKLCSNGLQPWTICFVFGLGLLLEGDY